MSPEELHYDCVQSVMQCPQCDYNDDHNDGYCKSWGKSHEIGTPLYEKGMYEVIKYWSDPNTIGGNLLWVYEYRWYLSEESLKIFDMTEKLKEKCLRKYFNE